MARDRTMKKNRQSLRRIISKRTPTQRNWEPWKSAIVDLYITKDLSLADVQVKMEKHGLIAT
jgi:Clr5 domain